MEENDEIHPQKSPESGWPTNDGGMTVTQAASPPPQNIITLALPAQQPKNGGGREDFWSESATAVLIEAWGERYLELSRGNLKQKHWKEVADIINGGEDLTKTPKTDIQCKNRIDTVKKKYKLEKVKVAGGGGPSKWRFFQRFDYLIGPTPKTAGSRGAVAATPILQIKKSPLGIPGRIPSKSRSQIHQNELIQKEFIFQKRHLRNHDGLASDSSTSERDTASPASSDSLPPFIQNKKRVKIQKEINSNESAVEKAEKSKNRKRGETPENFARELTNAILKFGEAYEITERSKLKQAVEMEKQRMKFIKELEMQKMEFFIKTQKEISQLKLGKSFK